MSKKLMITCDEATAICDKNQYGEASLLEKFKLNIHLLLCKHCRSYSMQNNFITKLLGKHLDHNHSSDHLNENDKKELENKLKDQIKEISKK